MKNQLQVKKVSAVGISPEGDDSRKYTFFLYKYKRKYNVKFANAVMKEMLKVNARQYSESYQ